MRRKHNIPDPLWRAMTYAKKVDEARQAYYTLYDRLVGLSPPAGGVRVSSTPNHDKFASLPIYEERWHDYKRKYDRAVRQASAIIEQIPDDRYQGILTHRYIEALTPQDSAQAMNYSVDWERHLHNEALEAFRRIWKG